IPFDLEDTATARELDLEALAGRGAELDFVLAVVELALEDLGTGPPGVQGGQHLAGQFDVLVVGEGGGAQGKEGEGHDEDAHGMDLRGASSRLSLHRTRTLGER